MGKRGKKGALSEEQKTLIKVLYETGNYSIEDLASEFSVWPTTIARLTHDIDLPRKHVRKVTPEDHMEMVRLHREGKSYLEISRSLGFSYNCVRRHVLQELDGKKP